MFECQELFVSSDEEEEDEEEEVPYKYHNPMIDELERYHEETLQFPVLERELDQGETDEDEIHMISNDKKLSVIDRAIVYLRCV